MLHVHSVEWNAGMGNTDTLHPNSCFCSFSIPTSEKFYSRCRDGETRVGMEGICITHSCIPLYTVYMQHVIRDRGTGSDLYVGIDMVINYCI